VPHRSGTGSMRAGNSENHHTWVSGIVIANILSLIFSTVVYSKHSKQLLYLYFKRKETSILKEWHVCLLVFPS
jgi:hypothetical protein